MNQRNDSKHGVCTYVMYYFWHKIRVIITSQTVQTINSEPSHTDNSQASFSVNAFDTDLKKIVKKALFT